MEHDFIRVNENYQTKESHIYAIGDVIGGMQLAHVASHEGIIAVEHMANEQPFAMNYENVPSCIYSSPEIASVGLTEKESIEQGFEITVGQFPFQGIGKALVNGESEGFVKIVANKENDDILGIHMIGPHVTELISEAGLAKVLDATPWEISQTIHPHPTLSEAMGEAASAVVGKQIHAEKTPKQYGVDIIFKEERYMSENRHTSLGLTDEQVLEMYQTMLLARKIDERTWLLT